MMAEAGERGRDHVGPAMMTEADVTGWLARVGIPVKIRERVVSSLCAGTDAVIALPGGPQVRLFQAVPGLYCAKIGDNTPRKGRP
jgi:hypothetical protein